mmetsp:Transcript_65399/g.121943  ORF Transcript_65399/g.121943 Transcript_65399/m.121943 type:complete len:238 (-) Transcript_65399:479-1192(-)
MCCSTWWRGLAVGSNLAGRARSKKELEAPGSKHGQCHRAGLGPARELANCCACCQGVHRRGKSPRQLLGELGESQDAGWCARVNRSGSWFGLDRALAPKAAWCNTPLAVADCACRRTEGTTCATRTGARTMERALHAAKSNCAAAGCNVPPCGSTCTTCTASTLSKCVRLVTAVLAATAGVHAGMLAQLCLQLHTTSSCACTTQPSWLHASKHFCAIRAMLCAGKLPKPTWHGLDVP